MDIRQKLSDLGLLLKQDRKAQVIAALLVLVVVWMMVGDPKRRTRYVGETPEIGAGDMGHSESYTDIVTAYSSQLKELQDTVTENQEESRKLREGLLEWENRTAEIFKKVIERMADLENAAANWQNQRDEPVDVDSPELGDLGADELTVFGDLDEQEVELPDTPERRKIALIGAGDSVRIKLLAGVNAPTDGTPYPVVFELADDVIGPDGSALPLGGARLIAAAQGSLTDSRALFRLMSLNIRYPDGSRKVMGVDGWVVGEDGIRGMEGILIDPIGKAMAGALLAGTVEGVGNGLSSSNVTNYSGYGGVTSIVDGELWEYAAGRGIANAASKWSDFIEDRADMMVPHVKVLSGRKGTAVFSKSRAIEGLFDAINDEEFAFASLD